ncbi:MAG: hypothetical protein JXB88_12290 [Spirochaetales bacterium]|nr:hypothetical protein [Spirochaetales bacterium]
MRKRISCTAIIILLLCFCLPGIIANPIPVPTLLMPEEWISISINEKPDIVPHYANTLEASVYGLYPMRNLEYEKVFILDPVPPKSYDISIALDGNPLEWTWSDMVYKTVLPEWPQIPQLEWTIAPVPDEFKLTAKYKHGLIYRKDEMVFFYPMGCWKGQPIYSPKMTAHMKTLLPGRYLPKGVFLDHDPAPFSLSLDPDTETSALCWVVSGDYHSKPYQALDRDYILTIMDRWGDPSAWFSQPPNMADGNALPSMDTINTPAPADDFVFSLNTKVNLGKLQFWGTYPGWKTEIADMQNAEIRPPQPEYIRVCIYDTAPVISGNKPGPGKLIYEYKTQNYNQQFFGSVVKEIISEDGTTGTWSYNHVFSYNIRFPRPFIPEPGKRYWISIISGPVNQKVVWSWVISPVPDIISGTFMQNNIEADDTVLRPQGFNLSFVLLKTPVLETDSGTSVELSNSLAADESVDTVTYCLVEGSTITAMYPYEPRPPYRQSIKGSFLLTGAPSSTSGFKAFKVNRLEFMPFNGAEDLSGKDGNGLYILSDASQDPQKQRMTLSLCIGGNAALKFDSGLVSVPEDIEFPWIDIIINNKDNSSETNSPQYIIHLVAVPVPSFSFSTSHSFTSGTLGRQVNNGDLLSAEGRILCTNSDLIREFNLYPTFAEQKVGLDAVIGPFPVPSPDGSALKPFVLFSTDIDILAEEDPGQGDILSNLGQVLKRNHELIAPFSPMPPIPDMGLDALAIVIKSAIGPDTGEESAISPLKRIVVFSTKEGFFSEKLGVYISPGDLLATDGTIYRTNKELFLNFNPVSVSTDRSIDIDAVHILSNGEVWFSTATSFKDSNLGYIGHGDLLSENGRRIMRNRDILALFAPLEDLDDFGLDSISVPW